MVLVVALFLFATSVPALAGVAEFSAADVYRHAASSVVLIFGFADSGSGSSGSGSILTADGLILTNHHVVVDAETGRIFPKLVVYLKPVPISGDRRTDLTTPLRVDIVARDRELDLALLRIQDPPGDLRPIEVADSEEVEIGESVAAIGHPGGGGLWTLTTGTISSKRRDQSRDVFQTDAAINPGNSGGPLLDGYARMVGVNTFVRRINADGLPLQGLNYSLRSSFALDWVHQQGVGDVGVIARSPGASREANARLVQQAQTATGSTGLWPSNSLEALNQQPPKMNQRRSLDANTSDPDPKAIPRVARGRDLDSKLLAKTPVPGPSTAPPPADPAAREFKGTRGERMYGVPNPKLDLHEALLEVRSRYEALTQRADESVDEMNRLLDDYDNF